MVTGTQMQTSKALWNRDLADTPETHLAEVKHQEEPKVQHSEWLNCEKLLYATIY
jgi:hypothetical protein